MHRKHIRRWHKFLAASVSLVAILAGLFVAPATAAIGPQVDAFWADTSSTNQPDAYFYLMTDVSLQSINPTSFNILGTATGCSIENNFYQSSFQVITVSGCSEGTVALQLCANSISDSLGQWGPSLGSVTSFTTIDRTPPTFSFDGWPLAEGSSYFVLTAHADSGVSPAGTLFLPTVAGDGCALASLSTPGQSVVLEITGCNDGANATVSIAANSFFDSAGNLGPAVALVSPAVAVAIAQTQVLPAPTATAMPSPTSTPSPTATPSLTPTASASASPAPTSTQTPSPEPTQAAVAPIIENPPPPTPQPPTPPAPEPIDVSPEQLDLISAPIATLPTADLVERTYSETPAVNRAAKPAAQAPVEEQLSLKEPTQPVQPQIVNTVEQSEPALNLSWVTPAASVLAAALAAIGAAMFLRKRKLVLPRLRLS
jgi:hypothetical protein